ncbi:MAG: MarR family winged helix-turn-helix transcriptional regulator [Pseudomonadota bacterium]
MSGRGKRLSGVVLEDVPQGVSLLAVASFRLARSLKTELTRGIAQGDDIGLVYWRVLLGLSLVENATQKELVEFTRTEQAQLSRALKEMEKRGLIAAEKHEHDGRTKIFTATGYGRLKFSERLPQATRITSAIDAALDHEEQRQFLAMCEKISRTAQEFRNTERATENSKQSNSDQKEEIS